MSGSSSTIKTRRFISTPECRQHHGDQRSDTCNACNLDVATVVCGYCSSYCEPQAAASGYRVLASKKPVKHVGNIFRQDTSAIILNRHVHISAIVKNANIRLSECVGVLDRIFDQAFECARHFFTIAVNRTHWIRSPTAHIEGFLLDQWLQSPQCLHHQFFDVDVGLAIHLPGISEPGEAKDVFDKPL